MSWFKNLFIPIKASAQPAAIQGIKLANPGAFIQNQTEISLKEWLPRFRPSERVGRYLSSDLSMHQVPHFWIMTKQEATANILMDADTFTEEGEELVKKLIEECTSLKASDKLQKKVLHDRFNEQLEELCLKTNITSGKWLIYLPLETVDTSFDKISLSLGLEEGDLAQTSAHTLKITTSPKPISNAGDFKLYELHLHCGKSFNRDELREMALTLKRFGVVPFGYELDANTLLSIHPNHPSGIPSPRYKISDFLSADEISEAFSISIESSKPSKPVVEAEDR